MKNNSIYFYLLVFIACILWGSAFLAGKLAFGYVPPVTLSGLRFSFAGILLIPFILNKKNQIKEIFADWKFLLVLSIVQTSLQYGIFFIGLSKVSAATSSIIVGAGPLFIAVMSHFAFHNDKITLKKAISVLIGLVGIIFISLKKGNDSGSSSEFYIGVICLILTNLLAGYANILVAKNKKPLDPIALNCLVSIIGGIILFCFGKLYEKTSVNYLELPGNFYLLLIWLAAIPAISFSIWYYLLKIPGVKVSDLNMWKFIVPVTGVILSWIFLKDETADTASIIGILIIVLALEILQIPDKYINKLRFKLKMKH